MALSAWVPLNTDSDFSGSTIFPAFFPPKLPENLRSTRPMVAIHGHPGLRGRVVEPLLLFAFLKSRRSLHRARPGRRAEMPRTTRGLLGVQPMASLGGCRMGGPQL